MEPISCSVVTIKNFLSIADAEIRLGQVNQVIGNNNQGKTSVLKAIEFALGGSTDGALVRQGEEKAEVIVELPDNIRVHRKLTAEGKQSVDVKRGEFKVSQPQTFLDGLFNSSAFNPLDLLDPKKRATAILTSMPIALSPAELAEHIGVDVATLPPLNYDQHGLKVLEQAHEFYFKRRAEANRDTKEKLNKYEAFKSELPLIPEAAGWSKTEAVGEIDVENKILGQLKEQIARVDLELQHIEKAQAKADRYRAEGTALGQEIATLERKIESLKQSRAMSERLLDEATRDVPAVRPNRANLETASAEHEGKISRCRQRIAEIERAEEVVKRHQMVEGILVEAKKAESFAEQLDGLVKMLAGGVKKKLMASVEMPIPGLEYIEGQFQVDGVPIDHLSTSKTMRLAIGVARKLAGKMKLICLDGAEALDPASYQALSAEVAGDGYTYIITKVGEAFPAEQDKVFRARSGVVSEDKPA